MPSSARHKSKGGDKDSAAKNTMNPTGGPPGNPSQTPGPQEQDPKRRLGQHSGAGEPPIMKK